MKERGRLLEERFERYERSQVETRDALDGYVKMWMRGLRGRPPRIRRRGSCRSQIHEIRKEHQVLIERDERHERRELELQEQLGSLRT